MQKQNQGSRFPFFHISRQNAATDSSLTFEKKSYLHTSLITIIDSPVQKNYSSLRNNLPNQLSYTRESTDRKKNFLLIVLFYFFCFFASPKEWHSWVIHYYDLEAEHWLWQVFDHQDACLFEVHNFFSHQTQF